MTGRTTAHLSFPLDDRYYELERQIGLEGMQHAAESHRVAVDCIETIVNREHLDCDFVRLDGYLFTPPGEGDPGTTRGVWRGATCRCSGRADGRKGSAHRLQHGFRAAVPEFGAVPSAQR